MIKLRVIVDVEVSPTMAENIQRNGFSVSPVGSTMRVKVGNSPTIPNSRTDVECILNPTTPIAKVVGASTDAEE
jgi:hypothetical protein